MKKFLLLFILVCSLAFSYSITLINDSAYRLNAIIQGADGTFLGEISISSGQQSNWDSEDSSANFYDADASLTPFTVIWRCPSGDVYTSCSTVTPGSMVPANSCPGIRYCNPTKRQQQQQQQSQQSQQ